MKPSWCEEGRPVAASMLTAAYHMLRVPYRDRGGDHFDQRDKRQVANRLLKRIGALGALSYDVEIKAAA